MEYLSFSKEGRIIAAYKSGKGKTLVGLSGFGCTHAIYLDLVDELSKNFEVILIENRGMGKSTPTTTDYDLSDLARDAQFVLEQLNINEYGLMGISMGGFIAQELYSLNPTKVKALSLMCTLSGNSDFIHPMALTELGLRQFAALDPQIAAELTTVGTTHPSLKLHQPEQYKKIVDMRIKYRADIDEQVRQNNAAVKFINRSFDLSIIKCPTLAMCGANDRFVNPKNIEVFQKNIEKCQTYAVPETDHFFFMEKPLEVAKQLNHFFLEVL